MQDSEFDTLALGLCLRWLLCRPDLTLPYFFCCYALTPFYFNEG